MGNELICACDDNADQVRTNETEEEMLGRDEWWKEGIVVEPDYEGIVELGEKLFCDGYYVDLLGEINLTGQTDSQLND